MSGLILPGQQQQAQLQLQIVKQGNSYVLVILTGCSQVIPLPPGALDNIEGFANAILQGCKSQRKQEAAELAAIQANGHVLRVGK